MTEEEGEALRKENTAQRVRIAELLEQVAKLNDRVAELLSIAQRKRRVPSAEKPPSLPPIVGPKQKRAFDKRPAAPKKPAPAPRE